MNSHVNKIKLFCTCTACLGLPEAPSQTPHQRVHIHVARQQQPRPPVPAQATLKPVIWLLQSACELLTGNSQQQQHGNPVQPNQLQAVLDNTHQTIWLPCASRAAHARQGRRLIRKPSSRRGASSQDRGASSSARYFRGKATVSSCHSCGRLLWPLLLLPLLLWAPAHQCSTPPCVARWLGWPDTPPASNVITCSGSGKSQQAGRHLDAG